MRRVSRTLITLFATLALAACSGTVETPGQEPSGPSAGAEGPGGKADQWGNADDSVSQSLKVFKDKYPSACNIEDVLSSLPLRDARRLVERFAARFEAATGTALPPSVTGAILGDPGALWRLTTLTPAELSESTDVVNMFPWTGTVGDTVPLKPSLSAELKPNHSLPTTLDLADLDNVVVDVPQYEFTPVATNLWYGDVNSDVAPSRARGSVVIAEILDRLAVNGQLPAAEQFKIVYNGVTHTRIDTFLQMLVDTGHNVTTRVVHRVANFANLKTRGEGGALLEVVVAVLVKTGIRDAEGNEAILPAGHSELQINVRKDSDVPGPKLEGDARFYQGIVGIGFFPSGLAKVPPWTGEKTLDEVQGDRALRAVKLAGLLTNLIAAATAEQKAAAGGYGVMGVCNDSVALVQQIISERATPYPLLMRDESVAPALKQLADSADAVDRADYEALAASVAAVPSDVELNASTVERALESLPWTDGNEPFQLVIDARKILRNN